MEGWNDGRMEGRKTDRAALLFSLSLSLSVFLSLFLSSFLLLSFFTWRGEKGKEKEKGGGEGGSKKIINHSFIHFQLSTRAPPPLPT